VIDGEYKSYIPAGGAMDAIYSRISQGGKGALLKKTNTQYIRLL
jgi:hypothetical protein